MKTKSLWLVQCLALQPFHRPLGEQLTQMLTCRENMKVYIKHRAFLGAILGGFLTYFTDFPTAVLVSSQHILYLCAPIGIGYIFCADVW